MHVLINSISQSLKNTSKCPEGSYLKTFGTSNSNLPTFFPTEMFHHAHHWTCVLILSFSHQWVYHMLLTLGQACVSAKHFLSFSDCSALSNLQKEICSSTVLLEDDLRYLFVGCVGTGVCSLSALPNKLLALLYI